VENKNPNAKIVVPVVVAGFLILASFVALTYVTPHASETAQPHFNLVLALLFSVFATAAAVIAIYESRLRFNVRPDTA
jgi:hypothetical protein